MTDRTTILNELRELESTLANETIGNAYKIPEGYFDHLAIDVISRIKALELTDTKDELRILSPFLSQLSKKDVYAIPAGYFESINEKIKEICKAGQTVSEELASISPLLSSIGKNNPYTVPTGYFDTVAASINKEAKRPAKVVSMSRKLMSYAAAAVITGILTAVALLLMNNNQVDPNKNPGVWVEKKVMKKVSADQVDEFVTLTSDDDTSKESNADVRPGEISELMKDVSEEEIQHFLNETASTGGDDSDVLLN